MRITPDTTSDEIREMERLKHSDMNSSQRRDYFEKLAIIHSGDEIFVEIRGEIAYVRMGTATESSRNLEDTIINIPVESPSQSGSDLSEDIWGFLFQKTELYHELGHVLYTDWPSFEDRKMKLESRMKNQYKQFWNVLEDAAIERALAKRFDIENDLKIKNENLLLEPSVSMLPSISEVIFHKLMEWKHPTGKIDVVKENSQDQELFEKKIEPIIDSRAPKIVSEPDPDERNRMYHEFFLDIIDFIDESDNPGYQDSLDNGDGDDANNNDHSEGREIEIDIDVEDDLDEENSGSTVTPETEEEIEREYNQEIEQQVEEGEESDESNEESMESWLDSVEESEDKNPERQRDVKIVEAKPADWDEPMYQQAKSLGRVFERDLRQHLRRERRTKQMKNRRSGRFDSLSIQKTMWGKTNVFVQNYDPDEKDYVCAILLDRSGSMNNTFGGIDLMSGAQQTAGSAAFAMESVGIKTAIVSVFKDDVNVEKDFVESMDKAKDKVFSGKCTGGTPLSDALALTRDRIIESGNHPFILVITDGEPDYRKEYRKELRSCNMPVLGLYVSETSSDNRRMNRDAEHFHRLEFRNQGETLEGLQNLIKTAMF